MEIPVNAPLVYISFSAEINPNTTENLIAMASECANKGVATVYMLLSTPGGSIAHGINLYNVLKGMPFELIIHNVGIINSIGNIIFLAGTKRLAAPTASFLFHAVSYEIPQNTSFDRNKLQQTLSGTLGEEKRIRDIICTNTKISPGEYQRISRKAQAKDAVFALSKGVVNDIAEVKIIPGNPIFPLVFQR